MPASQKDCLSLLDEVYIVKPSVISNGQVKIRIGGDSEGLPKVLSLTTSDGTGEQNGCLPPKPAATADEPPAAIAESDPWALPELQEEGVQWTELSGRGKVARVSLGIAKSVALLLLLYLFICSLDFLSSAFRLVGGKRASEVMSETELLKNPVVGLMLGVLATVLVQSSSTSTSIIITMVGSGLLHVKYAIPIIMGANIGTSVTNTIVSFSQVADRNEFRRAFAAATVHDMFNWLTVIVLLPVEVTTGYLEKLTDAIMDSTSWEQNKKLNKAFLSVITKPFTSLVIQLDKKLLEEIAVNSTAYANASLLKKCRSVNSSLSGKCGYLMEYVDLNDSMMGLLMLFISLILLCTCLVLIVKLLHSVLRGRIAVIIRKIVNADPRFPFNYLVGYAAILVGCGMTILVQSSSIFTSALTPLAGIGVITTERMYPLTLGSNIGTTTTGILAAFAADPKRLRYSLQIAFCHLFFNLSGIILFYPVPFTRLPLPLAKQLGNITAKYRWFAILYLLLMFLLLPGFVFALSLAGTVIFLSVGVAILCFVVIVVLINLVQRKRPSLLPLFLRDWNWLPECLHSLDPLDRMLNKICDVCKCCACCMEPRNSHDGQVLGIRPNQSKVNILDSRRSSGSECHALNGLENSAFAWKFRAENTKL